MMPIDPNLGSHGQPTLEQIAAAVRSVKGAPERPRLSRVHAAGVMVPSPITPGRSWCFATLDEGIAYLRLAWGLDDERTTE